MQWAPGANYTTFEGAYYIAGMLWNFPEIDGSKSGLLSPEYNDVYNQRTST